MNNDFTALTIALREQFGPVAVFAEGGDQNQILFTSTGRELFIRFLPTPGDVVPIRAVDVSRRGPIEKGLILKLANVNIRSNDLLVLALLNGYESGEDPELAQRIRDCEMELKNA